MLPSQGMSWIGKSAILARFTGDGGRVTVIVAGARGHGGRSGAGDAMIGIDPNARADVRHDGS